MGSPRFQDFFLVLFCLIFNAVFRTNNRFISKQKYLLSGIASIVRRPELKLLYLSVLIYITYLLLSVLVYRVFTVMSIGRVLANLYLCMWGRAMAESCSLCSPGWPTSKPGYQQFYKTQFIIFVQILHFVA